MMHSVTKWKVTVKFATREVVVWVHDNHLSNVLRKLADFEFSEWREHAMSLQISVVEAEPTNALIQTVVAK